MIRTLLADDAEDIRLLMRVILSRDDRFDVVGEAADGFEALELVETYDPDLLVLDLAMPRMDGLEVLQHLQSRDRPPIVVLSGFKNEELLSRALSLGARAYVTKGMDIDQLPDLLAKSVSDTNSAT
jgi:DNA-binding NarL/FixJ family response regulator